MWLNTSVVKGTKEYHVVSRGCSPGLLRHSQLRSVPQSPIRTPEVSCIQIGRVYTDSDMASQNSLFCLLTHHNDQKSR